MKRDRPRRWHQSLAFGNAVIDETLRTVAVVCTDGVTREEARTTAEFIVRACNSYEELLEALRALDSAINAIRKDLGSDFPALAEAWVRGRAAIAKAEGR